MNILNVFFNPTFIKDIKINIILLLENNSIKEKIFYDGFSDFYVTTFNERSNRFLAILCLASIIKLGIIINIKIGFEILIIYICKNNYKPLIINYDYL